MKTGGTKAPLPGATRSSPLKPGDKVICTHAASPGYRNGETYEVHANDKGISCIKARDGFVDICSMMVSTFKKVDE